MKMLRKNSNINGIKEGSKTIILNMRTVSSIISSTINVPIIFSFTKKYLIIEQIPNAITLPSVYLLNEWIEKNDLLIFTTNEHYSTESIIVKDDNSKVVISIKFRDGKTIDFIENL